MHVNRSHRRRIAVVLGLGVALAAPAAQAELDPLKLSFDPPAAVDE